MGINTYCRHRIHFVFIWLLLLLGMADVMAQCPTVTDPTQSFCDIQSPVVGSLSAVNNGGGVVWYATATSTTPLSSTSGLVNGEDYFADSSAGTCGTRPSVTVTIYSAPTGGPFQGVCVGVATDATIPADGDPEADIVAVGNNIQWYTSPTGGSPLAPGTVLNDNTLYYASQTNPETGCETSRLAVFVNVGVVPTPSGDATQEFCLVPGGSAPTVGNLVASGANNWYLTSSSASPLPASTPLINGQSYYATTVDPPCESTSRFEVTVSLLDPTDAGTNGVRRICANQVAATPPFNLFSLLGGSPDTTGTWSGPLPTSNGFQGTVNVSSLTLAGSPYVFTYNVTSSVCAPSSSTVTIEILPLPVASISANTTTVCSGQSATVTFTGTPGATVTYNINGGPNLSVLLNGSGTATITNVVTATATYNLVSVASSGTPSCSQPQTGSVTINVLPLPIVTIAANTTICRGSSATVTFTGTANATVTYNINGGPNQTIVLNGSGTAAITNTYTATTVFNLVSIASSGTPSCSQPVTGSVTITVIQPPVVAISGSTNVCPNGSATVTFTGTPNAIVTYTVNGGPNQNITLSGSGTAAITTTYTVTTTYTLISAVTGGTPPCSQPQSGTVTITVLPLPTASIASSVTICSGQSATVTFTGTPNAIVTYNINGGASQTVVLNASGTATITNTYTATTVFNLVSVASAGTPSCSRPLTGSVTITVVPLPLVTISSNPATVCPGGSATITFTGTANAVVTYSINGGGNLFITLNASGTATITGTYNVTTTYTLVSAATPGTPSCIQPLTGSATVTVVPLPTVSISASTTICSGQSATVTFTGTANAVVTYTVNGGPNQLITLNGSGSATITNTYTATTTFSLVSAATSGTPSCSQPQAGTVVITVVQLPVVTIAANTTICSGQSATVTFTGTANAVITYNINGGTNQTIILNASGTATITNTYTATTVFNLVNASTAGTPACTQPVTGSVTITVLPPPTVAMAANATICSGQTTTVTFTGTPNAIIQFTINGDAQTITLNGAGIATITNTYTATTVFNLVSVASGGTPGCSLPISGSVTIMVIQLPTVTISGTASVCPNGPATVIFTGTPNATVTYSVNGGPNQNITLNASGTAVITSNYSITTTYTLISVTTTGTPSCSQPVTGSVVITVLPPPTATIAASTTICSGESATVTFTGTANAVVTYNINGGANQTITLSASGTAAITTTYTSTTIYNLVSASTQGSPGCSQPLTGSVTITVMPPPTVTISASTNVCPGGTATITFTGTANAVVTYTINGGPDQTIPLSASGTATITGTYNVTTTYTLVSVATTGTPSCSVPQSGAVTITVLPLPTASIAASATTVCSGTSATITFTGTANAIVAYTITGGANLSVTLNSSGTATIAATLAGTTTYTLISVATAGTPSCSQSLTGSVTVTVTPPPVAGNDVANFSICGNALPIDLFALLGTAAQPGGTWSPALASGTGIFNPSVDPAGTYVYTVNGNEPCPADTASVTVTLTPPPNAGADAIVNYCSNSGNQNLFVALGGSAQAGGTWSPALASGTGIFNPAVDTAGIYTYTVAGPAPCGNDSATVTVAITPAANPGENGTAAFCANATPQDLFTFLNGTPQTGGIWSPALASGTGVFNPAIDAAGTYTYTVTGIAPCENASASVAVSIIAPPNAGNDATANICSNANPQDLFALLGANAQPGGAWSPALASGSGVFNPAVDVAGVYTYTVAGTAPCVGDSATVTVTITPGPDAGQDGSLTLCSNSTPQNLFNYLNGTPQAGGTWSPALSSGSGIFDPSVDAPGIYTYTFFGNQPCDNDTAIITVTVNPVPDAGTDGTAFFCTNYPASDLFASLGGTPQTGGTWSPALASGTGMFNPLVDAPGTYTYTVGGGLCATSTATVTVSVVQSPNAGGNGATLLINACVTSTSVDLFAGLNGSQGVGTWNDDDATGALAGNIFNPSAAGSGTYHFTYTVGGGVSPCLFDTATVTVVVSPQPNAGTFTGIQSVCTSAGTFDLLTLLDGTQQIGGVWTDSANTALESSVLNISAFAAGTYSYTYTITNACGTDAETVQLTILPVPALAIPNITIVTPICLGDAANLSLNGLADGTYALTYNLSGANTTADQTVNITVAGGTANFTILPSNITNTGTTTITFVGIANTVTSCSSALTNVQVNFVVRPLSNLDSVNLSAGNACQGSGVTVNILGASGLPDGNYQFNYNIPSASPATGSTGIVTVVGGTGAFTIPGSVFTSAGNYTITISNIISLSSECSNLTEDASASFQIFASPDVSGATVSAEDTCLSSASQVTISGAGNLADGTYTIGFQLSGASTAAGTENITFTGGSGTFDIPSSALPGAGAVTVTITELTSGSGICGANVNMFNPFTFDVVELGTPVLTPQGHEFCATDNPTIADLTANIVGSETVIWYDAETNGTAYNNTDMLENGATYYAAFTAASGCESPVRLEVTVDLTVCEDDILIPDGFSPNGDGINDGFEIVNLPERYPKFKLEIYNRYGNILYKGDINKPNWNGTTTEGGLKVGNSEVPVGVYFYILEFNDGTRKPQQGRLYLSR
ncbi:MAG TPA: gliding motility-associated C-terminal domain-containing protein [Flavobacterium sp.]|jgi:gliding motility-associated-like protein